MRGQGETVLCGNWEQRGKVWVCIPALLTGCVALGRLLNPEALNFFFQ